MWNWEDTNPVVMFNTHDTFLVCTMDGPNLSPNCVLCDHFGTLCPCCNWVTNANTRHPHIWWYMCCGDTLVPENNLIGEILSCLVGRVFNPYAVILSVYGHSAITLHLAILLLHAKVDSDLTPVSLLSSSQWLCFENVHMCHKRRLTYCLPSPVQGIHNG